MCVEGVGLGDMEGPARRASPLEVAPVDGRWRTLKICRCVEGKEMAVEFFCFLPLLPALFCVRSPLFLPHSRRILVGHTQKNFPN